MKMYPFTTSVSSNIARDLIDKCLSDVEDACVRNLQLIRTGVDADTDYVFAAMALTASVSRIVLFQYGFMLKDIGAITKKELRSDAFIARVFAEMLKTSTIDEAVRIARKDK